MFRYFIRCVAILARGALLPAPPTIIFINTTFYCYTSLLSTFRAKVERYRQISSSQNILLQKNIRAVFSGVGSVRGFGCSDQTIDCRYFLAST